MTLPHSLRAPSTSLAAILALAGCGRTAPPPPQPPTVPEALRAPAGEVVTAKAAAQGSQVYECQAAEGGFAWKLVGPDAVLNDSAGARMGKHYAGPTWEALDGSKVVASVTKKADAPDPGAVPWLLLTTKSTEGTGTFAKVTSIQRVDTAGGVAPAGGCDGTSTGKRQSIPYTATYYFYTRGT